jgi:hypothetical protein
VAAARRAALGDPRVGRLDRGQAARLVARADDADAVGEQVDQRDLARVGDVDLELQLREPLGGRDLDRRRRRRDEVDARRRRRRRRWRGRRRRL